MRPDDEGFKMFKKAGLAYEFIMTVKIELHVRGGDCNIVTLVISP